MTVPTKKMMRPRLVGRRGKYSKETGYFDPDVFPVHSGAASLSVLFGWCVPAWEDMKGASQPKTPNAAAASQPDTHRSFRESARGICMTAVLWRDCTGSGKKKKQAMTSFRHRKLPTKDALRPEVLPCWLQTAPWLCL